MAAPLLKRKEPSSQGAFVGSASGSYAPPGGSFGHLFPPEPPRPAGGQRRRRDDQSRVNHTLTPYFDGHLWRKYGQNKGALYPRLYFRCSYREDRHCMAAKRLQQLNDDSTTPLFEVTYMHEHTCNAEPVPPPDVVDATGPPDASGGGFVLNFGSSGAGGHHRDVLMPEKRQQYHHQTLPPSPFSTMGVSSFSNSQLHEMPDDFYPPNVPPATGLLSPMESWPSPPSMSSDEGDPFSTWNSFDGGFNDHVPYPGMFCETMAGVHQSHDQLSMYGN